MDASNSVVRIPKEDSAKNTEHWRCSLSERTVMAVERWLEERSCREKYEDTEQLWLTRFENPYSTGSLNRMFREICAEAGIAVEDRDLTWYSMRHSVGTYMAKELTVKAAAAQLRYRSIKSTLRYDRVPIEERKAALERMG
ncbi:site-specific integrase [Haloterrigena gelatinilytica]|uniref:site-specific integrase n=1 Tax=Haloterrigena gelatinilytica TaxID=2741724 RepID=UPI0028110F5D|nr:site-specific integrase [Haloterrigena gelatinilytica]